ncbi:hypothetical protein ABKV19_026597 [Rosa sericea]
MIGQCLLFSHLNFCSNYFLERSCLHLLQLATLLARDRSVAGLIFILASDKSCTHLGNFCTGLNIHIEKWMEIHLE